MKVRRPDFEEARRVDRLLARHGASRQVRALAWVFGNLGSAIELSRAERVQFYLRRPRRILSLPFRWLFNRFCGCPYSIRRRGWFRHFVLKIAEYDRRFFFS